MKCPRQLIAAAVLALGLACSPPGSSANAAPERAGSAGEVQPAVSPASGPRLRLVEVANGLDRPVLAVSPTGDPRLFVLEQPGRIRIVEQGALRDEVFLDITDRVSSRANERGLLGLAFHPQYARNGRFFVNYTRRDDGATVIAEFQAAPAGGNQAGSEERVLLVVSQPYANHNAGMVEFGPRDGYLYVGMGDGGLAGDPHNHGQKGGTLLGSMLRLDVDGARPYAIPSTNPFVGDEAVRDEIWALGLRNPWRFSFDRQTGDLWIADVGQNLWEEVHLQRASSSGGENYGWNTIEGSHCYNSRRCDRTGLQLPVMEYNHQVGCSVSGGYVYRGNSLPELQGHYFYGDACHSWVRSIVPDGAAGWSHLDWSMMFDKDGPPLPSGIVTFGQDAAGELYLTSHGAGSVLRIERASEADGSQ